MKKTVQKSLTLIVCMAGVTFAKSEDFTWDLNSPVALVEVTNKSISGALELPEIVEGLPLMRIHNMAFYGCDKIDEIIFPSCFETFHICNRGYHTKAGNAAGTVFEGCWALTNAVFKGEPPWNLQASGLLVYADMIHYPIAYSNQWRKVMTNTGYGGKWICYSGEWPDMIPVLENGKPIGFVEPPNVATNFTYGTVTNEVFHYSTVTNEVLHSESPYVLTNSVVDRAIASVTVHEDCAIDEFVLKDGKVYDSMLYVNNVAESAVKLSLPTGYTYKTFKGVKPLTIPAKSQCMISITRVADKTFLVAREDLEDVE